MNEKDNKENKNLENNNQEVEKEEDQIENLEINPIEIEDSLEEESEEKKEKSIDNIKEKEDEKEEKEENKTEEIIKKIGEAKPCQITITLGGEELDTLIFDQDIITIGRDGKCDVVIDNLGASRIHASIERIGKFFVLYDRNSKTGTYIKGKKVREYFLNDGDEIFLAKHTLIFRKLEEGITTHKSHKTAKLSSGARQQLMKTMAVDFRGMAQKQATVGSYLTILGLNRKIPLTKNVLFFGKGKDCDLPVAGFLIAERHVLLAHEDKGYFLYHLSLFKPPKVNGQPIEKALLRNGDLVEIGTLKFVFNTSEE